MSPAPTALAVLALLVLPALPAPGALAGVEAVDSLGRSVSLPAPARRIVALSPHIVENVFSAGAGNRLVGVVDYSDYPEAARAIARVGNFRSWSPEVILTLQPDLVLLWGSGNGAAQLGTLERLGLPVYVSELRRLEDIPASIRAIARLAGTGAVGERAAGDFEAEIERLSRQYRKRPPLSVFYQIWNDPLQTVNGSHLISQVIELCGGRNSFADAGPLAPTVGIEAVLSRDPDVILASGMDRARPEWLDNWRQWNRLSAVRHDALLFLPPDHIQRPTARVILGARSLCQQLETVRERRTQSPRPATPREPEIPGTSPGVSP